MGPADARLQHRALRELDTASLQRLGYQASRGMRIINFHLGAITLSKRCRVKGKTLTSGCRTGWSTAPLKELRFQCLQVAYSQLRRMTQKRLRRK